MTTNPILNLSDNHKGILLMVSGTILLLDTLGILNRWLDSLVIIGALFMIIYGFVLAGYYQKMIEKQ